jgi:hypothetical protein
MANAAPTTAGLFRPKFGGLFTAAVGTSPLAVLPTFALNAAAPTNWTHWNHLSRETLPSRSSEGGDSLTLGTWLMVNAYTEPGTELVSYEYTLNSLDAVTIAGLSALHGKSVSALEVWSSGSERYGKWIPNAAVAWTSDPMAEGVDNWAAAKFKLSVQDPPSALALATLADPDEGIAPWPTADAPTMLILDKTTFVAAA